MKKILVGLMVVVLAVSSVLAEGSVTESWSYGTPNKLTLSWTTSTNGIASAALTKYIRGEVCQFVSKSTNVATATYSVVLTNSVGVDLLRGLGASMVSNSTTIVCPGIKIIDSTAATNVVKGVWNDIPTILVNGLGTNICSGRFDLYWK